MMDGYATSKRLRNADLGKWRILKNSRISESLNPWKILQPYHRSFPFSCRSLWSDVFVVCCCCTLILKCETETLFFESTCALKCICKYQTNFKIFQKLLDQAHFAYELNHIIIRMMLQSKVTGRYCAF